MSASVLRFFRRLRCSQPEIAVAQVRELRPQIPLLYVLLTVNATAVAYTHYLYAPILLTVLVPAVLVVMSIARLVVWLRSRDTDVSPQEAMAQLNKTVVLAGVLAALYVTWALCLGSYGGPYEQGHVALFIAATVIGCIFCLMHLPQAAFVVTGIVSVPYLIYYAFFGNSVFIAIALNIALVTLVMIRVLQNGFQTFSEALRSQKALAIKKAEADALGAENLRLAHTDPLTSLSNRRYFFARLDEQIELSKASGSVLILGLLDLDRFKAINDTYGHVVGDRLLAEVGGRLAAKAPNVLVSRLGGDEFGFIAEIGEDGAASLGQDYCDLLSEPYPLEGLSLRIGCSCGMAAYPASARSAHDLFDRADYALYVAKEGRQSRALLYSTDHEKRIARDAAVETELRSPLLDEQLQIHFQPIVDATGRPVAVEALARWHSPLLGPMSPMLFIPIAERTGHIHDLTMKLLGKALGHFRTMVSSGISMSFNLSANDLTSPATVLAIIAMISKSGVPADRVILEITETAVMRDFELAQNSITLLRQIGVKIALDDFGTGQSSLGYLHRLRIDKVKIDRSFIGGLQEPWGRKIIASIIALCETLDLGCVVEGVEDEQQLQALQDLGCHYFQGYRFAMPMPFEQLVGWLSENGIDWQQPASKAHRA